MHLIITRLNILLYLISISFLALVYLLCTLNNNFIGMHTYHLYMLVVGVCITHAHTEHFL